MTSSQHGPDALGYTRAPMGCNKESLNREMELISKSQSQFRLKSAIRLHEAGIASNGRSARFHEYVPGPCTHRPSSDGSQGYPKSYVGRPKVKQVTGAKS